MQRFLGRIADSGWFQNFITIVILAAGVVVGFETYPSMIERYGSTLHLLNDIILFIFIVEIVVKMGAHGRRPWLYFYDPWNVFDFLIVAACFLPVNAQYVTVLRLARLLRVLKLVRALPKLQILVGALLKSIPSMGYVSLLLLMLFYLYAVAATFMFGGNDPVHFGNLQTSMLSLFRAVTLEDWTDLMYINMYGCNNYGYDSMMKMCTQPKASPVLAAGFFVSFVMVGTMVVLNLFIGVIMTGMDEARLETELANEAEEVLDYDGTGPTLDDELGQLEFELKELHEKIVKVRRKVLNENDARETAASSG